MECLYFFCYSLGSRGAVATQIVFGLFLEESTLVVGLARETQEDDAEQSDYEDEEGVGESDSGVAREGPNSQDLEDVVGAV